MQLSALLIPLLALTSLSVLPAEETVETLPALEIRDRYLQPETRISLDSGLSSVLASEDWLRIGASDLAGALRRVPGVTISRYNVVGSYGGSDGGAVFIRGHGSARPGSDISILLDGIPRVVGVWSHPLLDTISIDTAAAMHVHKSPQPVLLGNMAFGAVNIIPNRQTPEELRTGIRASLGRWNTHAISTRAGIASDKGDILFMASQRQSDGHRPNASGKTRALFLNAAYRIHPHLEARYLAHLSDSRADDPQPEGVTIPVTERYDTSNAFQLIKVSAIDLPVQANFKAYLEGGKADWRQWHQPPPQPFPAQVLDTRTDSLNSGFHFNLSSASGTSFEWETGVHLDRIGGASTEDYAIAPDNRFDSIRMQTISPFAHLSWQHELPGGSVLRSGGGLRYFRHDTFENQTGSQLALAWDKQALSIQLQYARTFNYPGVFVSIFGRRPAPWNVGQQWQDLEAEKVDAYELTFHWKPSSRNELTLSVFRHDASNALRIVSPPPVGYIHNMGSYTTEGIETSLRTRITPALHTSLSATWMQSDTDIPNLPGWNLQASAVWTPHSLLEISMGYQHTSSQKVLNPRFSESPVPVDGFHILDASIRLRLPESFARHAVIFANFENLADAHYEYRPGYPMPRMAYAMGIELRW